MAKQQKTDKNQDEEKKKKAIRNRMLLLNLFSRYIKIFTSFLVLAIFALGYYYVIVPKYESIISEYDLEGLFAKKTQKEGYLTDLRALSRSYGAINQEDIKKLYQILPKEKEIANLFAQLQAIAEKHDLAIYSMGINEAGDTVRKEEDSGIKKLSISLDVTARDYFALKEFLNSIELNLRLFDINAVYFSRGATSYTINMFTYYLSE